MKNVLGLYLLTYKLTTAKSPMPVFWLVVDRQAVIVGMLNRLVDVDFYLRHFNYVHIYIHCLYPGFWAVVGVIIKVYR